MFYRIKLELKSVSLQLPPTGPNLSPSSMDSLSIPSVEAMRACATPQNAHLGSVGVSIFLIELPWVSDLRIVWQSDQH